MPIPTNVGVRSRTTEFLAAVAWGLVVLGLTFVILLLGAIVLPAQAYETPSETQTLAPRAKCTGNHVGHKLQDRALPPSTGSGLAASPQEARDFSHFKRFY